MKILSWNCRGLGNPGTVRALKKILGVEKPSIVFLMETRLKTNQMNLVNGNHLKFESCLPVDCDGDNRSRKGGLCVLWSSQIVLNLISFSCNHLTFKVVEQNATCNWYFSGIYEWPESYNRDRTWRLMSDIKPPQGAPWLCLGDFNSILWSSEKKGGNPKSWSEMYNFRATISTCNLTDLGWSGNRFTWSNGRGGDDNIMERLDRALASTGWKCLFPVVKVRHLPRFKSDHNPMLVEYYDGGEEEEGLVRQKRFRFEHMWLHHPQFTNTLKSLWENSGGNLNFSEKTNLCGKELLKWDRREFGNVREKNKELQQKLLDLQAQEQSVHIIKEIHQTEFELDKALKIEESLWHQRARITWLKEGDKNTKFFHQKATHRQRRNNIQRIKKEDGQWSQNRKEMTDAIKNYFINLFSSDNECDFEAVVNSLESKVSEDMNERLIKPYTAEDVVYAIKQMHPTKAPGPDEAFSNLISKAEHDGRIHGIKVAKNAPVISHLFFADDTILFTNANDGEATEVKSIISQYERASGQKINLEKTKLTVSSNVTSSRRNELSNLLGVKGVEEHDKYLGLPTIIGRNKRKIFDSVLERIQKKLKDWKEQVLTKAGREVLIKAVIQAIPSYIMNCFMLPITVCQEIERAIARFFWGASKDKRKCHWLPWDQLCRSKSDGGLGFREMHHFNLSMLAKQFWNLLNNPESTTAKILCAKYFPDGSILKANLGHQPSYLWRSLLAARPLVNKGKGWRVGNGSHIDVWNEAWIGVKNPTKPSNQEGDRTINMQVSDLIDTSTMKWKMEVIQKNFSKEDVRKIVSTPLSARKPADRRIWRPARNGMFSVKTAYHLAISTSSHLFHGRTSSSQQPKEWSKLWKINVIPNVRNFCWRACLHSLPTKDNLIRRKLIDDPICELCREEMESIDHLMLRCPVAAKVWYWSPLRINIDKSPFTTFKEFFWNYLSEKQDFGELMAYTASEIWKGRNRVIFDRGNFNVEEIIGRAQKTWTEGNLNSKKQMKKSPLTTNLKWYPPSDGVLKLNTDAAICKEKGLIGLGFILRDVHASVIMAGKMSCTAKGSSTLIEGLAIRYALQTIDNYKEMDIIVEADSKQIIECINNKEKTEIYCDVIVADIQELMHTFKNISFTFASRKCNRAAHVIAHGPDFLSVGSVPSHVFPTIAAEARSN